MHEPAGSVRQLVTMGSRAFWLQLAILCRCFFAARGEMTLSDLISVPVWNAVLSSKERHFPGCRNDLWP